MNDLDELLTLVPPPDDPPPPIQWTLDLPAAYRALIERYGPGTLAGLLLLVPGHPNPPVDLLRQVEPQRWALQYLIDQGIEEPYAPGDLLPWGIDESGNVVWWLMRGDWPVVANEARGEDWQRYDGGAVAFLAGLLSGRETSELLVLEGDDFVPETGPYTPMS